MKHAETIEQVFYCSRIGESVNVDIHMFALSVTSPPVCHAWVDDDECGEELKELDAVSEWHLWIDILIIFAALAPGIDRSRIDCLALTSARLY